jgi:uncharacterized protein YccT (UPF0319 family)
MNSAEYCSIITRINELSQLIYQTTYQYHQALTGTLVNIQQYTHKIKSIKAFYVLDADGNEVTVHIKILSDESVQVTSNVDMTGLTLYLF